MTENVKYVKAKTDLLKALKSVSDLNESQKRQLFKEIMGDEAFFKICQMMSEMQRQWMPNNSMGLQNRNF